jgi:hypothetical protein
MPIATYVSESEAVRDMGPDEVVYRYDLHEGR